MDHRNLQKIRILCVFIFLLLNGDCDGANHIINQISQMCHLYFICINII